MIFTYGYFCQRDYEGDFPYTDLAAERRRADTDIPGVEYRREVNSIGEWERIEISSEEGARSIGRPMGIYDTLNISRMDLLDSESIEDAREEVRRELCYIFEKSEIIPERILVAGLGNPSLTPDSIGAECAKKVKPTMHIKEFDGAFFSGLGCSEIAVITPGVIGATGIEAADIIHGVCNIIKPNALIAIDALAARAVERLGTTVQICNTGIAPGSGLGNSRRALKRESLGIPVIAIGVPTVIDSRMFWYDSAGSDGYEKSSRMAGPAMFVSPKEINEISTVGAEIIAGGINEAFGLSI